MARTFEIMPRDPIAKGLQFQSSIYEPIFNGRAHNLICEVYIANEAEYIKHRLNTYDDLLASCEMAMLAFEKNAAINWDDIAHAIEKARGHE